MNKNKITRTGETNEKLNQVTRGKTGRWRKAYRVCGKGRREGREGTGGRSMEEWKVEEGVEEGREGTGGMWKSMNVKRGGEEKGAES